MQADGCSSAQGLLMPGQLAMPEPLDLAHAGASQAEQPERSKCQSRALAKATTRSYSILYACHNSHRAGHGSHPRCSIPIPSFRQRSHYLSRIVPVVLGFHVYMYRCNHDCIDSGETAVESLGIYECRTRRSITCIDIYCLYRSVVSAFEATIER